MLLRALKLLGANAGFHIPHRFTEGYGIQQPALEKARAEGYTLVVSASNVFGAESAPFNIGAF